ncbi:MAG: hypothetical protein ACLFNM_02790 [Candidatus Woesearchaeota archaeon]
MNKAIKKGLSFGLISGIITTLGMVVGLDSATQSTKVILGSIFIIAVADGLSDAFGIHVSEEADEKTSEKSVWQSTFATIISKILFALSFAIPILIFTLPVAIVVCVIWGLGLVAGFSYYVAKINKKKPYKAILEHVAITIFVIVATYFIGQLVASV